MATKETKPPVKENLPAKVEANQALTLDFISNEERQKMMGEQLSSIHDFKFPRISLPSGKSAPAFDLSPLGEEELSKELEIIALWNSFKKAWFEKSFEETGGKGFPDCFSNDGVRGQSKTGKCPSSTGRCIDCPMNIFGTGKDGKGKACRDTIFLYFLRDPATRIPALLRAPVMSLRNIDDYISRLSGENKFLWQQWTIITLEKVQNQSGIAYYKMVLTEGPALSKAEAMEVYKNYKIMLPIMQSEQITAEDAGSVQESSGATAEDVKKF